MPTAFGPCDFSASPNRVATRSSASSHEMRVNEPSALRRCG